MTERQMTLPRRSVRKNRVEPANLYVLTNRANVLSMLSCGLLRPLDGYEKYYRDILELCPGRLTVWCGPVPVNVPSLVSDPEDRLFPVILELDGTMIRGNSIRAIDRNLQPCETDLPADAARIMCILPGCVIPVCAVKAIHFQAEQESEDFKARTFDNIDFGKIPSRITPMLFKGPEVVPENFLSIMKNIPAGPLTDSRLFRRVDAAGGAIVMLAAALPEEESWVHLLRSVIGGTSEQDVLRGVSGTPGLLSGLVPVILGESDETGSSSPAEYSLIGEALKILAGKSPKEGIVPDEFIRQVSRVGLDKRPSKENRRDIENWQKVSLAVAKNEREAPPLTDQEKIGMRALLLFALRPETGRILQSRSSGLKVGEKVIAVAATLAGSFSGYARLGGGTPEKRALGDYLSALMAEWCNRAGEPSFYTLTGMDRDCHVIEEFEKPIYRRLTLIAGGSPTVSRRIQPPEPIGRIYGLITDSGISTDYDPDAGVFQCLVEDGQGGHRTVELKYRTDGPEGRTILSLASVSEILAGASTTKDLSDSLLWKNGEIGTFSRYCLSEDGIRVQEDILLGGLTKLDMQFHLECIAKAVTALSALPVKGKKKRKPKGKSPAETTR